MFLMGHGRKNLDVLSVDEVHRLVGCADEVWSGGVALTVGALVATAAFTGMRTAELYGLRWADIDFRNDELHVERQYSPKTRRFELPKNGQARIIVLTPQAKQTLLGLPRPVDSELLVFRASRGGPMTGRVQHYYWNPVRCRFGRPSMDFYELRHFCAAWLFNDLELPAQDVAHQLGLQTVAPWCSACTAIPPNNSLVSASSGLSEAPSCVSSSCRRLERGRRGGEAAPQAAPILPV